MASTGTITKKRASCGGAGVVIHQLRYYFPWWLTPDRGLIVEARDRWLAGEEQRRGVRVESVAWTAAEEAADTREAIRKGAWVGRAGVVKQYGAPNLTLCDYDTPEKPPTWFHVARIGRMFDMTAKAVRIDRTIHGWHMLIWWSRDFTPREIITLQCLLGSDPKRETYNFARVMSGKADPKDWRWNLLFNHKVT